MIRTPAASHWLAIANMIMTSQALAVLINCAVAIAKSRSANQLERNHLERAMRWLVTGD